MRSLRLPFLPSGHRIINSFRKERMFVFCLKKINHLKRLTVQRDELDAGQPEVVGGPSATKTQVSKNVLDEFAQTIEGILQEWHFPNANRVFFAEDKRDFQIAGKERGSTGKGLRAITHAAVKIGLMEFCRERNLPHPRLCRS